MGSDLKIRAINEPADDGWLEMRFALWPHCDRNLHLGEMRQLLAADGGSFLAETSTHRPLGFAEISIRHDHVEGASSKPTAYLEGWYVAPRHRRQGIGRSLIEAAVRWAVEAGYDELASDAEIGNQAGVDAHRHAGFQELGRSVHFVRKLVEPAVE